MASDAAKLSPRSRPLAMGFILPRAVDVALVVADTLGYANEELIGSHRTILGRPHGMPI